MLKSLPCPALCLRRQHKTMVVLPNPAETRTRSRTRTRAAWPKATALSAREQKSLLTQENLPWTMSEAKEWFRSGANVAKYSRESREVSVGWFSELFTDRAWIRLRAENFHTVKPKQQLRASWWKTFRSESPGVFLLLQIRAANFR